MAYSDFTASEISKRFGVKFKNEELFTDVKTVEPSNWLIETIKNAFDIGFDSLESRLEGLVTPVLLEFSFINNHSYTEYARMDFNIDTQNGLEGECDFLYSFSRVQEFITDPFFCLTRAEATKQDVEQGIIQCAAQLVAGKKLNDLEDGMHQVLYGCCTTGVEWTFLQYADSQIIIDKKKYLISELPQLLGVFQHIFDISR